MTVGGFFSHCQLKSDQTIWIHHWNQSLKKYPLILFWTLVILNSEKCIRKTLYATRKPQKSNQYLRFLCVWCVSQPLDLTIFETCFFSIDCTFIFIWQIHTCHILPKMCETWSSSLCLKNRISLRLKLCSIGNCTNSKEPLLKSDRISHILKMWQWMCICINLHYFIIPTSADKISEFCSAAWLTVSVNELRHFRGT